VPFIRHSRDKRGYETTVVLHSARPGQGAPRPRVLYLFRSPANLRVGRRAFDEEVVEALEHTHPEVAFDWPTLTRESAELRAEPDRPRRSGPRARHQASGRSSPPSPPRRTALPPEPAVAVTDESILGAVLGASEAARLRQRHADLLQRIGRRARTPEDRVRLLERLQRLNPEDWPDEAAVRAGAAGLEGEFEAIAAELPARRRGRRGGRRRAGEDPADQGASAIMVSETEKDADGDSHAVDHQDQVADPDWPADAAGDPDGVGPEPESEPDGSDDL